MNFVSRRNEVSLRDGKVVKRYSAPDSCACEAEMLRQLQAAGVAVPKIISAAESELELEYIDGQVYADLLDRFTWAQAKALSDWILSYRKATGLLRGDVNLRNFLYFQRKCWGVDFEEPPKPGRMEVDLGKILAFAATYEPVFTDEKSEAVRLLHCVFTLSGGDKECIKLEYFKEIQAMKKRRALPSDFVVRASNFWGELFCE